MLTWFSACRWIGLAATLLTWPVFGAATTSESAATIRQAVERFVGEQNPNHPTPADLRLGGPPAGVQYPSCQRLELSFFGTGDPYSAQTVAVQCAKPVPWTVYVPVRIVQSQKIVVAAHSLTAGTVLTASDLALMPGNAASLAGTPLSSLSEAMGRTLRFGTVAGQPITQSMLAAPIWVHGGNNVTLVAEGDGVRITTLAQAIENGHPGQSILVRNLQSGRVVRGTVTAVATVRVPF